MSKTRPEAWENKLTDPQKQAAFELVRDLGGPKARAMMLKEEEFDGVAIPATSTIYRFYERYKQLIDEDRLRRAVAAKASIEKTCDEVGDVEESLKKGLGFLVLEAVATGEPDKINAAIAAYNSLLSRQTQQGELKLKQVKFEAEQRIKSETLEKLNAVKSAGGLTEETMERIEEALNLL